MTGRSSTIVALLMGWAAFASGIASAQTGPLLQPGEPYPGTAPEPIHLHLPTHKASEAPTSRHSETSDLPGEGESAPQVDLIHPPRHRHKAPAELANTAPASDAPVTVPFSLDGNSTALPPATPRSARSVAGTHALPSREASIAPATAERPALTKRGAILFEKGASSPSPAQYRGVKVLAENLNNALEKGAAAIQLEAYGGSPGDKSSDARRLSLRRALAVRQLLIDDGVPSARIDVRAMGGADDKDSPDRVDVFIRTG